MLLPISAANQALMVHRMLPMRMDKIVGVNVAIALAANLGLAMLLVPSFAHTGMAIAVVIAQCLMLAVNSAVLLKHRLRETTADPLNRASAELA